MNCARVYCRHIVVFVLLQEVYISAGGVCIGGQAALLGEEVY